MRCIHRTLGTAALGAAALTLLLAACTSGSEAPLGFEAARVRAPLPGTDKTVGYVRVHNNADAPIVLVAARAPGVRAVEFHTTIRDRDTVRMRRLETVEIAPGDTVEFAPGGNHLMLFGVTGLPERVPVTFVDAEGVEYPVSFETFTEP